MVVADAGPLIALGLLDALALLSAVHRRVIVPREVERECLARPDKPAVAAIGRAFAQGRLLRQPDGPVLPGQTIASLGAGESAAIELAEALDAIVLIDERRGRAVAAARGLRVIGTVAVLLTARQRGHIPAIAPLLQALREGGYFLSDGLVAAALARAGES